MNKTIKTLSLLLLLLSLWACKDKPAKVNVDDTIINPRIDWNMSRTKADTTTVLDLAKAHLDALQSNNIDSAMDMLTEMKDSVPSPISDKRRNELIANAKAFPVLNYKIDDLLFYSESDTEVHYTITLFEKEEGDTRPNTISGVINPRRIDGKWYLTISDKTRETDFKE